MQNTMHTPEKLLQLIKTVAQESGREYIEKLALDFEVEDFLDYIHFSKKKYVRTCVAKNKHFELILIAWEKEQKTAIHEHDGSEAWVYVLKGAFEETRYETKPDSEDLVFVKKTIFKDKMFSFMEKGNKCFHTLKNIADGRSLSLHLYKKPIRVCKVYDEKTEKLIQKKLAYDFDENSIQLS